MKRLTPKLACFRGSLLSMLILVLLIIVAVGAWGQQPSDQEQDPLAVVRGAKVWVDNCNRCHNYRGPKEFRDDLWRPIVFHMQVRAGLTGQETRDVLKFLQESN